MIEFLAGWTLATVRVKPLGVVIEVALRQNTAQVKESKELAQQLAFKYP